MTLLRPWLLVLMGGALVAAFAFGWRTGAQTTLAAQAAALEAARAKTFEMADRLSRAEEVRLELQAQRDALALSLEEAAYADPDADRPALSSDSVRRINQR